MPAATGRTVSCARPLGILRLRPFYALAGCGRWHETGQAAMARQTIDCTHARGLSRTDQQTGRPRTYPGARVDHGHPGQPNPARVGWLSGQTGGGARLCSPSDPGFPGIGHPSPDGCIRRALHDPGFVTGFDHAGPALATLADGSGFVCRLSGFGYADGPRGFSLASSGHGASFSIGSGCLPARPVSEYPVLVRAAGPDSAAFHGRKLRFCALLRCRAGHSSGQPAVDGPT